MFFLAILGFSQIQEVFIRQKKKTKGFSLALVRSQNYSDPLEQVR